jgi:hypothetical protein
VAGQRAQDGLLGLGVSALTAAWLATMWPLMSAPPATRDALLWIGRGAGPGWLSWALGTPHFVGYRPLAALSYTANAATLGISAQSFRGVDLGLFVCAGLLLAALARRWFGALPALLAVTIYFLHPAGEEIVVDVARRSYTLSAVLLLCGLLSLRRRWLSAALLGGAILCNEMALVPAALAPLLLAWRHPDRRWQDGWPTLTAIGGLGALRLLVLRGGGGYGSRSVVMPWAEGGPLSDALPVLQVLQAAAAGPYQLLMPVAGDGQRAALWSSAAAVLLAIGAARALWRDGAGGLLLAWSLGHVLLAAVAVTWFWRMAYLPLLPLCLAAALIAQRKDRLALVAVGLLSLGMLTRSPLVTGARPDVETLVRHGTLIEALEEQAALRSPGDVIWLVLPYTRHRARATQRWLTLRQLDRVFVLAAHLESPLDPIIEERAARAGTVKIHEDAVLGEEAAVIVGARVVSAETLPAGVSLVWVTGDEGLRWLP